MCNNQIKQIHDIILYKLNANKYYLRMSKHKTQKKIRKAVNPTLYDYEEK